MRLYLVGATGGGFSVRCSLIRQGVDVYGYLDDRINSKEYRNLKYSGVISRQSIGELLKSESSKFITAIGSENNYFQRSQILHGLGIPADSYYTFISNNAIIEASIDYSSQGIVLLDQAFVGYDVALSNNVFINTMAYIGHETVIGDATMIGPNVTISGNVRIGKDCYLGSGCTIKGHVSICDQVLVGCGSTVVKDIISPGVYVGNPAKLLYTLENFIARK